MKTRRIFWILLFGTLAGCVDRINFNVPLAYRQLVVDGSITNQPGPYTISLFYTRDLKADLDFSVPVTGATITIFSDAGEEEDLRETLPGIYITDKIAGAVGRSYNIRITTKDGAIYESKPDLIRPAGEIESIRYEYEQLRKVVDNVDVSADRFNLYLDSQIEPTGENYIRWRVVGTYKIETQPGRMREPPPCSGWEFRTVGLVKVYECTCCICWVTNHEDRPQVSDEQFIQGNEFRHAFIGTVPITSVTFIEKYHVSVSQMSLTRNTFNYFRLVKAQIEGVESLFQPVAGKLRGNISRINGNEEVQGLFWAAGVTTASLFIGREDVPYPVPPPRPMLTECDVLKNSTASKPDFWE